MQHLKGSTYGQVCVGGRATTAAVCAGTHWSLTGFMETRFDTEAPQEYLIKWAILYRQVTSRCRQSCTIFSSLHKMINELCSFAFYRTSIKQMNVKGVILNFLITR